jgi:nucleotide-binding universal stress UspA family protein
MATKQQWSAEVTRTSDALDLEEGVFTWRDPKRIAKSLKLSALSSTGRNGNAFQSAMSMLNFYINRAGTNLSGRQVRVLEQAKVELGKVFESTQKGKHMSVLRVVWALDPFEPSKSVYNAAIQALSRLRQRLPIEILPIGVLSPAELSFPLEYNVPQVQPYRKQAEATVKRVIESSGLSGVASPGVITEGFLSRYESVNALIDTARKKRADLIVLNTHGRKGLRKLVVGSFAETLLLRTPIPVLLVGPHVRMERRFDKILFPTDFGPTSNRAFKKVVEMAGKLRSRLVVYHAVRSPVTSIRTWGVYVGGVYMPLEDYLSTELRKKERRAQAWVKWAQRRGVRLEVAIETTTKRIPEAILLAATRKQTGFIAMEAQSGRVAAAFLGSSTREVVRAATRPVYVVRLPKSAAAKATPSRTAQRAA